MIQVQCSSLIPYLLVVAGAELVVPAPLDSLAVDVDDADAPQPAMSSAEDNVSAEMRTMYMNRSLPSNKSIRCGKNRLCRERYTMGGTQ